MNIKEAYKIQGKTITVMTEKQHEFSNLELEILNLLYVNGYYETRYINDFNEKATLESDAMYLLQELNFAKENEQAWKHTINVDKTKLRTIRQILEANHVR